MRAGPPLRCRPAGRCRSSSSRGCQFRLHPGNGRGRRPSWRLDAAARQVEVPAGPRNIGDDVQDLVRRAAAQSSRMRLADPGELADRVDRPAARRSTSRRCRHCRRRLRRTSTVEAGATPGRDVDVVAPRPQIGDRDRGRCAGSSSCRTISGIRKRSSCARPVNVERPDDGRLHAERAPCSTARPLRPGSCVWLYGLNAAERMRLRRSAARAAAVHVRADERQRRRPCGGRTRARLSSRARLPRRSSRAPSSCRARSPAGEMEHVRDIVERQVDGWQCRRPTCSALHPCALPLRAPRPGACR